MRHPPNIPTPRRSGAFTFIPLLLFSAVTILSFWIATEWSAAALGFQAPLGSPWTVLGHWPLYPPWAIFVWEYLFSAAAPQVFMQAFVICVIGPLAGVAALIAYAVWAARKARIASSHGTASWAVERDYPAAGLHAPSGVVLGLSPKGEFLRDDGPEHIACIAPSRSGKGVGQVIPTLLTWPASVLVHDMKGENWQVTAAWRAKFSHVIYFNPTDPRGSAHFNPLLEVRADENQIRDVQNIADQLVDPHGKGKESHWDRTADQFLLGCILHVLHSESDKSLYGLSKFLSDPKRPFTETLNAMKSTPHDRGMAHERIASSAQAMLNKSEEERSGILSTTLGFLGLYADPIVARNTADSDFRILDLMQAEHPVSLYLVVPDSDRLRLKPLTRLMMTMITQRLVEVLNPKENRHRLLMLIDEFPRLGKLPFFVDALSYLAGYGVKVMLIMQSKSQLDAPDCLGPGNTVVESCRIRSLFTPQDPLTAQWISDALGDKTEVHQQTTFTGHRLAPWLGHVMVADQESSRPLLDAAEICKMPASDAIVLVAGFAPFRAKRLKFYEHPELAARAALPPVKLRAGGPYPYRPKPHPNPWLKRDSTPAESPTPAAAPPPAPPPADTAGRLPKLAKEVLPEPQAVALAPDLEAEAERACEQEREALEAAQQQRRGLDEVERVQAHHHGMGRKIPL